MSQFDRSRALGVFRAPALSVASLAATFGFALVSSGVALAVPTTPTGIWFTKGEESIIKVAPCPDAPSAYCGTLIWLKEPNEANGSPKLDTLNKDPAKKNQPMIGVEILVHMKAADDLWKGKAYNPEDGKFYDVTFKVKTDKEENDQADLRGCILGFLCQTETFTRAKAVPGGEPHLSDAGHKKKRKGAKKDAASQ